MRRTPFRRTKYQDGGKKKKKKNGACHEKEVQYFVFRPGTIFRGADVTDAVKIPFPLKTNSRHTVG